MFYSPKNEIELKNVLLNAPENTFFIAGGTDLIIHLKKK